jgi:hypothetical protein
VCSGAALCAADVRGGAGTTVAGARFQSKDAIVAMPGPDKCSDSDWKEDYLSTG